jgi:hypothetical protein
VNLLVLNCFVFYLLSTIYYLSCIYLAREAVVSLDAGGPAIWGLSRAPVMSQRELLELSLSLACLSASETVPLRS